MTERSDLRQLTMLVHPFPDRVIKKNPSGNGTYVAHPVVEQRLIDVLGHPPTTELVQVVRGDVDEIPPNPDATTKKGKAGSPARSGVVVGCVLRMSFDIDGKPWSAEECGDCESPQNWPHDGARLKDAMSDAYKRCAMRAGVALHLWAQEFFYLSDKLMKQDQEAPFEPQVAS